MRKPIGQAFLLNNRESLSKEGDKLTREVSHIRNTTASFNSDIIGPGAEAMLNKAFRDAKSFASSPSYSSPILPNFCFSRLLIGEFQTIPLRMDLPHFPPDPFKLHTALRCLCSRLLRAYTPQRSSYSILRPTYRARGGV